MSSPVLPGLGRYTIKTNQMEEFVNVACLWIRQSVPGALVHGRQRAGKTTAAKQLAALIQTLFNGSVGCVLARMDPAGLDNHKQFWGELLRSMKLPVQANKSAEVRRDGFIGRVVEAASLTEDNKVVVIIDEASLFQEDHWLLLFGLDNVFRETYEIDLTWIFVGQPELADMPALQLGQGRREVVGRLMADSYEFRDMTEVEDFKRALSEFGTLEHRREHRPLSERANPGKYKNGWRFEDDADVILEAVDHAREEDELEAREGMTMQCFVTLATHLIVHTIPRLQPDEALTSEMVLDAIEATNCLLFERHHEMLWAPSPPAAASAR